MSTPAERVQRIMDEAVGSDLSNTKKVCRKCGLPFSGDRCKPCLKQRMADYYIANREKQIAKAIAYNNAHPEHRKKYRSDYYKRNKVTEIERAKKWASENKLRVIELRKSWRLSNIDYARKNCLEYRKSHPESYRIYAQNRRLNIKRNGGKISKGIVQKLLHLQKGKCVCCGLPLGGDYHLDHIMPLHLGGAHEDWNIQLLRSQCNHEKHAKHPVDFMQSRGFLL